MAEAMNGALDSQKGEWVVSAKKSLADNLTQLTQSNYRGVKYETQL